MNELTNYKQNMVEEMAMHNEDMFGRMDQVKSQVKVVKNKVAKTIEQNELLLERLVDFQKTLGSNSLRIKELEN
jgi:hypothetical protein